MVKNNKFKINDVELLFVYFKSGLLADVNFNLSPLYKFKLKGNRLYKENLGNINIFSGSNLLNVTAVIGENGVGKTTLLKNILQLSSLPLINDKNDDYFYNLSKQKFYIAVFRNGNSFFIVNNTSEKIFYNNDVIYPSTTNYSIFNSLSKVYIGLSTRPIYNVSSMIGEDGDSFYCLTPKTIEKEKTDFYCRNEFLSNYCPLLHSDLKDSFCFDDYLIANSMAFADFSVNRFDDTLIDLSFENLYAKLFSIVSDMLNPPVDYDADSEEKERILKAFNKIKPLDCHSFTEKSILDLLKINFICEYLLVYDDAYFDFEGKTILEAYKEIKSSLSHTNDEYFFDAIKEIEIIQNATSNGVIENSYLFTYTYYLTFKSQDLKPLFNMINNIKDSFICKYLRFSFHLSDGENTKARIGAYLYYINNINRLKKSSDYKGSKIRKNILLLLDECDVSLHPNGKREFLNEIINYVKKNWHNNNIQIVFTSHSPIVLSDVPNCNTVLLRKCGGKTNIFETNKETFAAPIYSLYNDSFFFDEGLMIGDFAKNFILEIDHKINNDNLIENNEIKKEIELIGEPLIKKTLEKKYNQKITRHDDLDTYNSLIRKIVNKYPEVAEQILEDKND